MAKIHILEGSGGFPPTYTAVVHANTPAGNNAAGTPWADAIKNSGRATSVMTAGNGPGQIATNELTQIQAGAVVERVFLWGDDPTWTNQQRIADLDLRATQMVNDLLTQLQKELNYFGFTRT